MTTNKTQVVGYSPHNVMGQASSGVYLNEPMDKVPEVEAEPQNPPESGTPTSDSPDSTDWKKRYGDAKSHFDKTIASMNATINELKTQTQELKTKTETSVTMPKTLEEYKVFKEKYPELAANIETAAITAVSARESVINTKLKQLEDVQDSIRAQQGVAELKKYHSDFEEIKDDPRFHAWFNEQLPEIQNLIRSSNPKVIAEGLSKYKKDVGIKTPAEKKEDAKNLIREPKNQQRVQIEDGAKRTWTEREIFKLPLTGPNSFEFYKDEIALAQREGRILKS